MDEQILANPDLCTGCNRCTYACSAVKNGDFRPSAARLHINNFPLRGYSVPSVCFQCPKAACQESCPVEAMSRTEAGVVVVVDLLDLHAQIAQHPSELDAIRQVHRIFIDEALEEIDRVPLVT